ncbi:helix-turn-helix transcriptional regulator [Archangium violaceum]|uniref:helix-turn-helix domain-containing protein n=1 Tax=Archangium violaceum TaxID=83451 RepID=UPI00193C0F29|nr:helix-turn-helix transcriptional regulator [Archangium violaceum]QRK05532.1 helix-turn-helix transcriptional regulator [Archangium violaceum]
MRTIETPKAVARNVGRRVAELRGEQGLTQEEFSAEVGVSLRYLQQVEAGRENLTIESLVKLARHLRVRVVALFEPAQIKIGRRGRPPRIGGKGTS